MNNVLSMLSIRLFVGVSFFLAVLMKTAPVCERSTSNYFFFTVSTVPAGCIDVKPITDWFQLSVVAIAFTLFVSYLPFVLQILCEFGFRYAFVRFSKHIASLTSIFEVFSTQIYAYTLMSVGLSMGGSAYVSTGRGFATSRIPFYQLFTAFSKSSIQLGFRMGLTLGCVSLALGLSGYLAFFWMIAISLCLAPFLFNPHMFDRAEFFMDYRRLLRWFWHEKFECLDDPMKPKDSWVVANTNHRTRFTGSLMDHRDSNSIKVTRSSKLVLLTQEALFPFLVALCFALAYAYLKMAQLKRASFLILLGVPFAFALVPVVLNAVIILVLFVVSLLLRLSIGVCSDTAAGRFGLWMASFAKVFAVVVFVANWFVMWMVERWSLLEASMLWVSSVYAMRALLRVLYIALLGKEFAPQTCNEAWWTGRWSLDRLGYGCLYLPVREFTCKLGQQTQFAVDFCMAHILLFGLAPVTMIPHIDRYHSLVLLWVSKVCYRSRKRSVYSLLTSS